MLNEALVGIAQGGRRRLLVMMPPRHGKSEMISHYFAAWYLMLYPDRRIILCSYEAQFAAKWGRAVRDTLQELGVAAIGDLRLADDSTAANRWDLKGTGGGMITTGVGGPITGYGAHLLIIDDPVKNDEEARSATMRERTWDWYRNVARTRLEPDGSIVLIMTRWHKDDLVGRLLEEMGRGGERWDAIKMPALALPGDPLGRREGEALWPERFDVPALLDLKASCDFQSLYQQDPVEIGGDIFKREWWRTFSARPPAFDRLIHSWDTAYQTGSANDYSVCTVWGETEHGFFWLDTWRQKVEFPELKRTAVLLYIRDRPNAVLIEDRSSGQSLLQELARDTKIPFIAVQVDRDKRARAYAVTATVESGRVFVPADGAWVHDALEEMSSFPKGAHDDVVDSVTQALGYLRSTGPPSKCVPIEQAFGGTRVVDFAGGVSTSPFSRLGRR